MEILGIDPGTLQSAYVLWDGTKLKSFGIVPNDNFLDWARNTTEQIDFVALEAIQSMGMAVGQEVFDTVRLVGRLQEIFHLRGVPLRLVYRREEKLHHCLSPRANDSNIRQALIDRFGAPGTKKAPGRTFGLKKDIWQAFGIGVLGFDKLEAGEWALNGLDPVPAS